MIPVLALTCAAATAALVVAEWAGHTAAKVVTKTVAAGSFVALAFGGGALEHGATGQAVFAGLCLSMVGDLCLLSRAKPAFLAGLVAFLLAHVAYVVAFVMLGLSAVVALIAAVPLGALAGLVWRWLAPHVESLARPVQAYILVISAMVACAIAAAWVDPSPVRIGLMVSAVAFFLSDLCVARDRFVAPGPANRTVGLPLYFGAQLGYAFAATAL